MRNENKPLELLRKETLELLEVNFAHDVINVDEYERRVDIALNTSIEADLVRISGDLVLPKEQNRKAEKRPVSHTKKEDLILGILSRIERRSNWIPAKKTQIFTLMGRVELDFTGVQLPSGTTYIDFFCVMGHLNLIVPEGVRVEMFGLPVMGSIDNRINEPEDKDCPVIKVRGLSVMGHVEAKAPRKRRGRRHHRRQ